MHATYLYITISIVAFALLLAPVASTQQQLPLPSVGPQPSSSVGGESRPSPDPTRLTTEQLIRELNSLREILTARLDANDKASKELIKQVEKLPDMLEKRVMALQLLHEERFASIGLQFKERDARTEQTNLSNKTATDAAFQAAEKGVFTAFQSAKEAAAKSEAGFSKQIEQLANLFATSIAALNGKLDDMNKALNSKFDDLKSRVGALEGLAAGNRDSRETSQASLGSILGVVSVVIALIAVAWNVMKKA